MNTVLGLCAESEENERVGMIIRGVEVEVGGAAVRVQL